MVQSNGKYRQFVHINKGRCSSTFLWGLLKFLFIDRGLLFLSLCSHCVLYWQILLFPTKHCTDKKIVLWQKWNYAPKQMVCTVRLNVILNMHDEYQKPKLKQLFSSWAQHSWNITTTTEVLSKRENRSNKKNV